VTLIESEREMGTPKQTVSVLFFFSIITMLWFCLFEKFDMSAIVFIFSEIYQLMNRRNMILVCHFILFFIVKDSGLLSPRRNGFSVYKESRVVPIEKERKFEVKEVRLERKEELRESHTHRSLDIVVIEKIDEVTETDGAGELDEKRMEVIESSGEGGWDYFIEEEVERNEEEVWEVMERSGAEEEKLQKECTGAIECNGEEELEIESVEELNKKIEEFIKKIRCQMRTA
jgi:hypothetical protein